MKALRHATLLLLTLGFMTSAQAGTSLPAPEDKEGWHRLIELFAECSAVYNIAATVREAPATGPAPYRELANNALVAGVFSTQRVNLGDDYLESIYSVKYGLWQHAIKEKSQLAKLFARSEQCIIESLPLQNQLLSALRERTARSSS